MKLKALKWIKKNFSKFQECSYNKQISRSKTKVHKVNKFSQKDWLALYTEWNSELWNNTNNPWTLQYSSRTWIMCKNLEKLSLWWKTKEDIARYLNQITIPQNGFLKNVLAAEMRKTKALMNTQVFLGFSIQ